MGAVGACGLFASIVFHEFAHSLVARQFGIEMSGITLFVFGGVAEMKEEPRSPKAEFFMAIAGTLSSVVLVAVFWASPNGDKPAAGRRRFTACLVILAGSTPSWSFQSGSRVSSRWRARGALGYLELE